MPACMPQTTRSRRPILFLSLALIDAPYGRFNKWLDAPVPSRWRRLAITRPTSAHVQLYAQIIFLFLRERIHAHAHGAQSRSGFCHCRFFGLGLGLWLLWLLMTARSSTRRRASLRRRRLFTGWWWYARRGRRRRRRRGALCGEPADPVAPAGGGVAVWEDIEANAEKVCGWRGLAYFWGRNRGGTVGRGQHGAVTSARARTGDLSAVRGTSGLRRCFLIC